VKRDIINHIINAFLIRAQIKYRLLDFATRLHNTKYITITLAYLHAVFFRIYRYKNKSINIRQTNAAFKKYENI